MSSHADVIVVGAGVVGCTIAFELASAGRRVRVIDARAPGGGASWASAGVLAPYVEGHESAALRTLGRRSLDLYPSFVARIDQAADTRVPFERPGTLETAITDADVARLRRSAAVADRDAVAAHWLDGAGLHEAEPALGQHLAGALHIPSHAAVDVPTLTHATAAAARRLGVVFDPPVAVTALHAADDGVMVETAAGPVGRAGGSVARGAHVVLAAGAWSAALAPLGAVPPPVRPVRGQLLYLATTPGTLCHVVWGPDVYIVPWRDGRVFIGATSEDAGFDERATAAGVAGLLDRAIALVPALAAATFLEARHGLRPGSPDDLPFVGYSAVLPGLIYACGHYRNGALLAPLTAALVAQLVAGQAGDPALVALAPSRAGRL